MAWTKFNDTHSGGYIKLPPYEEIFIEAPENVAIKVFFSRFGFNPRRITCTCCGNDFSIYEQDPPSPNTTIKIIPKSEIPEDLPDEVPIQGYIWH